MGARRSGDQDFHSERDQVAAMERLVERLGGRLEVLPSELDVSGGLPIERRPSLLAAVEGVESGRFCGIVIAYQSRLGRDVEYEETVWRRVERAGGRIEMALDGIDTSTVDGTMLRRIRGAMNAAERERHVERFEDLRRTSTAAGVWQRRQTPLGYSRDPDTRRLVPDERAEDVLQAFRDRGAAVPVLQIADRLGMTANGVRALIRNRVYLGELRVGDHVNAAAHPAIVTLTEWEHAQRTQPRPARRGGAGPALLAGIARCRSCGHGMARTGVSYQCFGRSSAGRCPGPAGITARLLDAHVTEIALTELERVSLGSQAREVDVDDARERLQRAERGLADYLAAVSVEDVGAQAFAAGARARRELVDHARDDLHRRMTLRPAAPTLGNARGAWEDLDAVQRNAVLRALLEAVAVTRAGGRGSRGSRGTISDRVRVFRSGAGLNLPRRTAGRAAGIIEIPWPDLGDERVLGVLAPEDPL